MNFFFKLSFISAIGLLLLTYSCGDLQSFQESISFKTASVKQNGLAEVQDGVAFRDNNSGVDLMITYIPKNKTQSGAPTSVKIKGSVFTYPNENDMLNNSQTNSTNLWSELPPFGESLDETELREIENDLLKRGFIQKKIETRSTNFFKTNSFKEGDMWNGGIKVMKTLSNISVWATIQAKCVGVTDYAYFFTEVGFNIPPDLLSEYTKGFSNIYPTVVKNFGTPNDVDGNGKVVILFYDMGVSSNTLGYFYSADKYPKSSTSFSNESDIFYVNYNFAKEKSSANTVLGTLAHEFQHMIYFDMKYNKITNGTVVWADYDGDSWLNEGLSMLSEYYTKYDDNVNNWILGFLYVNYSGLSLTHWTSANYGYSGIFTRYLLDKEPELPKKIYDSNRGGLQAVEIALEKDFNVIFADFIQTIYLSNQNIKNDPYYNFTSLDLSKYLLGYTPMKAGDEEYVELKPYGFTLIKIEGNTSKLAIPEKLRGYTFIKQ